MGHLSSDGADLHRVTSATTRACRRPRSPEPAGANPTWAILEELLPLTFRLGTCSPNPFNPVTSIDYDVPEGGGLMDISVFDVAGRLVTTLYSGHHESGTHSVTWNGRDDRGRDVASGIYFVRLVAEEFQASSKMVLLK